MTGPTNTTATGTRTEFEAETRDGEGRRIYHYVDSRDMDALGVALTLCGRLMYRDDLVGGRTRRTPPKGRGWTICPMCDHIRDEMTAGNGK